MGGFLYFITFYISLVWNITELWSWAWSGLKKMKPIKWYSNCCLCASAPDSAWGFVCLGGVRCLKCLFHTGAVVTRRMSWLLKRFCMASSGAWICVLGARCIRGDLRAGEWVSKAFPCPPSVTVIPSSQWERNMAQVWKRHIFLTGPSGLCCSFPAGKPSASQALRHLWCSLIPLN